MTMSLLDMDVLRAVGWALLHFLWQGTALSLVCLLLLRVVAKARASTRYVVALAFLASAPIVLIATIVVQLRASTIPVPGFALLAGVAPGTGGPVAGFPLSGASLGSWPSPDRAIAVVALAWLVSVAFMALRLAATWRAASVLARALAARAAAASAAAFVEEALARAQQKMHFKRAVRLACVSSGHTPAVVGWLRAVIVVPMSVVSGLPASHVELLLAHELAHVRRHDFLVNALQSLIETLLFFHPGVWWLTRRVRIERELACDEAVVAAYGRPMEYGEALASLALLDAHAPTSMAATSSPLVLRIRLLLTGAEPHELLTTRWIPALAALGALIAALAGGQVVAAQTAMRGMVDQQADATASRIVARHEHRNRHWARSVLVQLVAADGQLVSELRLGRQMGALRFVALLAPGADGDTAIVSLRAERYALAGRRAIAVLPLAQRSTASSDADSLLLTFVRESGLSAASRAAGIARQAGTDAVLRETRDIGDPTVAATYLASAMPLARTPHERDQLVTEALGIRNASVDVARVVVAAMRGAATLDELARLVDRVPQVSGDAERLELLREAVRLAGKGSPAFDASVERAMLSLPGDDARAVVRRALDRSR